MAPLLLNGDGVEVIDIITGTTEPHADDSPRFRSCAHHSTPTPPPHLLLNRDGEKVERRGRHPELPPVLHGWQQVVVDLGNDGVSITCSQVKVRQVSFQVGQAAGQEWRQGTGDQGMLDDQMAFACEQSGNE